MLTTCRARNNPSSPKDNSLTISPIIDDFPDPPSALSAPTPLSGLISSSNIIRKKLTYSKKKKSTHPSLKLFKKAIDNRRSKGNTTIDGLAPSQQKLLKSDNCPKSTQSDSEVYAQPSSRDKGSEDLVIKKALPPLTTSLETTSELFSETQVEILSGVKEKEEYLGTSKGK